jgi:hypothetical protein
MPQGVIVQDLRVLSLPAQAGRAVRHPIENIACCEGAYLGCTFGSPPGVPGGGRTLSRPPPGGGTCICGSTPVGGQMTPFDCASLSLRGSELFPSPTVGDSPLTSGGHVTLCCGAAWSGVAVCAAAGPTPGNAATSRTRSTERMRIVSRERLRMQRSSRGNVPARRTPFAGRAPTARWARATQRRAGCL